MFSTRVKIWYILLIVGLTIYWFYNYEQKQILPQYKLETAGSEINAPVSLRTYYLIEKYSEMYDVPKYIAYNIAYKETRYMGPFDWKYNPYQTSSAKALGPMQVLVSTAEYVNGKKINTHSLKTDLELNISTSMKLLNMLYKDYRDWTIVCGYYNTGYPIVNEYARFCASNKKYVKNWKNY